ncbi:MAG: metal-dependent phosphohydrolase region [Gemmatimonadetes bacterium]|jgi:HD-GYP domain-containing protein (c-di-GMP phosphodiesterase class II)|nr:metal-dependent phosphohydrolase region [Gemmatimonadota bacterium]
MSLKKAALAGAAATGVALLVSSRQRRAQKTAERFAAASLETLLNAIDANDAETGAHVRRVATYALILADAADLPKRQRRAVERVALFHDVGKIHEALFDIIHDDAKLSPADKRAIATHPRRGAQVLSPLNGFYPDLPEGVLSHHERWDGKGYPRCLKGRRIPLAARIVAIADTFDAVTHQRRYRGGQSAEVGRQVILDGRGSQFDPEFVDLFVFPAVFEQVVAALTRVSHWAEPVQPRRTGRDEANVPDISFRWRPGRHGGRGHAASDQVRQTPR